MKKILAFAVLAVAFLASCTPKTEPICVDKFYANPAEFLGKQVTITGHVAGFCTESGKLVFTGCEKANKMMTNIPAGVTVDSTWNGKTVEVVGVISETTCPESGNKCYAVEATSLKITEACCSKEGKEGACCGEHKEGCAKDSSACASKDSTGCASKDTTGCGACPHNKDAKVTK